LLRQREGPADRPAACVKVFALTVTVSVAVSATAPDSVSGFEPAKVKLPPQL
jgi:hypothetical protein